VASAACRRAGGRPDIDGVRDGLSPAPAGLTRSRMALSAAPPGSTAIGNMADSGDRRWLSRTVVPRGGAARLALDHACTQSHAREAGPCASQQGRLGCVQRALSTRASGLCTRSGAVRSGAPTTDCCATGALSPTFARATAHDTGRHAPPQQEQPTMRPARNRTMAAGRRAVAAVHERAADRGDLSPPHADRAGLPRSQIASLRLGLRRQPNPQRRAHRSAAPVACARTAGGMAGRHCRPDTSLSGAAQPNVSPAPVLLRYPPRLGNPGPTMAACRHAQHAQRDAKSKSRSDRQHGRFAMKRWGNLRLHPLWPLNVFSGPLFLRLRNRREVKRRMEAIRIAPPLP
jgi:hypothetical protein